MIGSCLKHLRVLSGLADILTCACLCKKEKNKKDRAEVYKDKKVYKDEENPKQKHFRKTEIGQDSGRAMVKKQKLTT